MLASLQNPSDTKVDKSTSRNKPTLTDLLINEGCDYRLIFPFTSKND
jgi:hypothetical protein